mgnify:CR=1 FL=1
MNPVEKVEQLTLFPPGTRDHANLLVIPGSEKARKMTAISGQKLLGYSRPSDPLGLLVRTLMGMSHWGSIRFLMTWKISTTPRNRFLFQLTRLTGTMSDTEYLSWPTPTASQDYKPIRPLSPSEKSGSHGKMLVGVIGNRYPELIGAYLDPRFQESLMGFPEDWTKVE